MPHTSILEWNAPDAGQNVASVTKGGNGHGNGRQDNARHKVKGGKMFTRQDLDNDSTRYALFDLGRCAAEQQEKVLREVEVKRLTDLGVPHLARAITRFEGDRPYFEGIDEAVEAYIAGRMEVDIILVKHEGVFNLAIAHHNLVFAHLVLSPNGDWAVQPVLTYGAGNEDGDRNMNDWTRLERECLEHNRATIPDSAYA
jgi:hypothetical protein